MLKGAEILDQKHTCIYAHYSTTLYTEQMKSIKMPADRWLKFLVWHVNLVEYYSSMERMKHIICNNTDKTRIHYIGVKWDRQTKVDVTCSHSYVKEKSWSHWMNNGHPKIEEVMGQGKWRKVG